MVVTLQIVLEQLQARSPTTTYLDAATAPRRTAVVWPSPQSPEGRCWPTRGLATSGGREIAATRSSSSKGLYDLDALESSDSRYKTAREDAIQHLLSNADWDTEYIFSDSRFQLSSGDDEALLRFLAETLHPAVRTDRTEVQRIVTMFNGHLRPDGWELLQRSTMSGRPVWGWRAVAPPTVSLEQIRAAIADAVATLKAYDVEDFCTKVLALPASEGDQDNPQNSKRAYVHRRINAKTHGQLLDLADRVMSQIDDADLRLLAIRDRLVNRSGRPTRRLPTNGPWATRFTTALDALRGLEPANG